LGAAPVEGRISGIVDIPNACCTLYLPTEMAEIPGKISYKSIRYVDE
jgi:acetamidase/formamidase